MVLLLMVQLETACGSVELLGHSGVGPMHSPMAYIWAGPSFFQMNTSALSAPLYDMGMLDIDQLCGPFNTTSFGGRTVLLSQRHLSLTCSVQTAYLELVSGGARGIIVFLESANWVPGQFVQNRGWGTTELFASKEKAVPMVEISRADGHILRSLLTSEAQPVHAIISPDENYWVASLGHWAWILVMRLCIPAGHFGVAVVAVVIAMRGRVKMGTTKAWVVYVELVTASILAVAQAMGAGYYDTFFGVSLPDKIHAAVLPRLAPSHLFCNTRTFFFKCGPECTTCQPRALQVFPVRPTDHVLGLSLLAHARESPQSGAEVCNHRPPVSRLGWLIGVCCLRGW